MLVIRFARTGRKNKAQFRIVVQEHTATPTGRNVEIVGNWNPHQKEGAFKKERIEYWLSQGAKASDSVHNLLVSQKVINDKKRAVKFSKKKSGEDEESKDAEKSGEEIKETETVKEGKEEAKVEEEKKEDDKAEKKEEDDKNKKA